MGIRGWFREAQEQLPDLLSLPACRKRVFPSALPNQRTHTQSLPTASCVSFYSSSRYSLTFCDYILSTCCYLYLLIQGWFYSINANTDLRFKVDNISCNNIPWKYTEKKSMQPIFNDIDNLLMFIEEVRIKFHWCRYMK